MKQSWPAIRQTVAAGFGLAAAHLARAISRWARRPRMSRREAEAKAFLVGYHGPIDPAGRWLEDLSAGRIDHDGNPREYQET